MIRDTRWLHPRPNPTPAARRACAQIAAVLAAPPSNRSPADLLAERERLRAVAGGGGDVGAGGVAVGWASMTLRGGWVNPRTPRGMEQRATVVGAVSVAGACAATATAAGSGSSLGGAHAGSSDLVRSVVSGAGSN